MKLKELRKEKKVSQEEIAKFLNVTQQTYCRYEKEQVEPTIETLSKLADYYSVSVDYIIGRNFKNGILPEQDKEILYLLNQLNELNKGKVIGYAKACIEDQKEKSQIRKINRES